MRGRIINNIWDEGTGVAIVTKATPYGTYTAATKVAAEDRDVMTSWDGFHFCEMKCDIQAMHEKSKRLYQRAIGIQNALKALDNQTKLNPDLDPYTLDMLGRQADVAFKEAKQCKEIYKEMRDAYPAYTQIKLNQRRKLRDKVEKINPED